MVPNFKKMYIVGRILEVKCSCQYVSCLKYRVFDCLIWRLNYCADRKVRLTLRAYQCTMATFLPLVSRVKNQRFNYNYSSRV